MSFIPWPKLIHAVEIENRVADELDVKLQAFPHAQGGEVLKIVITRKGEPVGVILPNAIELH